MKRFIGRGCLILSLALAGCSFVTEKGPKKPRLCLFVGLDVSGSFIKGRSYDDGLEFLGRYLHAHMNGLGGLEVPDQVFVGPIGGKLKDENKTFYPKQAFEGRSPEQITAKLWELFPKPKKPKDDRTDYNTFFDHVADAVKERNLVLRPITIVMIGDGVPAWKAGTPADFRTIKLDPLENLSRNVTVRMLYTSAPTAKRWQTEVPRKRVRVWTQDAAVMVSWKDKSVLVPGKAMKDQAKFFAWLKDNVDFPVHPKRVD